MKKVHKDSRDNIELRKKALREPVSAINFARRFHAKNILPAAFLLLSRTRYTEEWKEWAHPQYRNAWHLPTWIYFEHFALTKRARWSLLTKQDFLLLGKIHDNVETFLDKQMFEDGNTEALRQCVNLQHDHEEINRLRTEIRSCLRTARDVFGVLSEYCDGASERRKRFTFCKPCSDYVQDNVLLNIRSRLWKVVKDTGERATHFANVLIQLR